MSFVDVVLSGDLLFRLKILHAHFNWSHFSSMASLFLWSCVVLNQFECEYNNSWKNKWYPNEPNQFLIKYSHFIDTYNDFGDYLCLFNFFSAFFIGGFDLNAFLVMTMSHHWLTRFISYMNLLYTTITLYVHWKFTSQWLDFTVYNFSIFR